MKNVKVDIRFFFYENSRYLCKRLPKEINKNKKIEKDI